MNTRTSKMSLLIILLFTLVGFSGCEEEEEDPVFSQLSFANDVSAFETEENQVFDFVVNMDNASDKTITVDYMTTDITATAGEDYLSASGTLTFAPGVTSQTIEVTILIDAGSEADEQFMIALSNPINGYLKGNIQEATGTIRNDDTGVEIGDDGYTSATSYPGRQLIWSDEFDGNEIDPLHWTYDLGNNGWGNNELQNYTDNSSNSFIQEGKLVIKAIEVSADNYTSARLKSQGLQEFQYGRIDVRAILPIDQGLWPAIWMLGGDFSSVGWPACGEIDIMELVGSDPGRVHGTLHWGADPGQHNFQGGSTALDFPNTFADEFHVFSIEWDETGITWLLNDVEYYSMGPADMNGQPYPFDDEFFFIMNVAVGGIWPGNPDETTTFPKFMAVDYVRVFQ